MNWIEIGWLAIGFLFGVTVLKSAGPIAYRFGLKVRFWIRHGRKGKPVLFVYSESSNWRDEIETRILPRIEPYAVILSWSRRREWESRMQFEVKMFNQWCGPGEFVPMAIVFPVAGKVRTFRLWQLSTNPKHGKDKFSKQAEQDLLETVKRLTR